MPPIAAVVLSNEAGEDDSVIFVELTEALYQQERGVVSYEARLLDSYEGRALRHWAGKQRAQIPKVFGQHSLYLDFCPSRLPSCYGASQCDDEECCRVECGVLPKKAAYCWEFAWGCVPCHLHEEECNVKDICPGDDPVLCPSGSCATTGPQCVPNGG